MVDVYRVLCHVGVCDEYDTINFKGLSFANPLFYKDWLSNARVAKGILNLPTSSLHLCSPFHQNR